MTQMGRGIHEAAVSALLQKASLLLVMLLTLAALPHDGYAGTKRSAPATGRLRVWVPARIMVDVECWVYLDGKLVGSVRPEKENQYSENPQHHPLLMHIGTERDGWMIVDETGVVLSMRHERWNTNLLTAYVNAPDPDALHFFRTVEVPARPGKHVVEVAYRTSSRGGVSASGDTFPFVITRKTEVTVKKGETAKYYSPIPDRWLWPTSAVAALRQANMGCEDGGNSPPDQSKAQRWMETYLNDPIVKALHAAEASATARSGGVVVLDLPQNLGGPREFDGRQIHHLAKVVSDIWSLPSREELASCRSRYPQYSRSYAEYDRLLQGMERDFRSFDELARKLGDADERGR